MKCDTRRVHNERAKINCEVSGYKMEDINPAGPIIQAEPQNDFYHTKCTIPK